MKIKWKKTTALSIALIMLVSLFSSSVPVAYGAQEDIINVVNLINQIPPAGEINPDNRHHVVRARLAYNALSNADKLGVSIEEYRIISTAEAYYVINMIKDIDINNVTTDNFFDLTVARDAYLALVSNISGQPPTSAVPPNGTSADLPVNIFRNTMRVTDTAEGPEVGYNRWLDYLQAKLWAAWVDECYDRYKRHEADGTLDFVHVMNNWHITDTFYGEGDTLRLGPYDEDDVLLGLIGGAVDKMEELVWVEDVLLAGVNIDNYNTAKVVEGIIDRTKCDWIYDKPAVESAREAYDSLTDYQKSQVNNYRVLKDYENQIAVWEGSAKIHPDSPPNLTRAGSRVSNTTGNLGSNASSLTIGSDGNYESLGSITNPWPAPAGFEEMAKQMTDMGIGYFPGAEPTFIWIIGLSSGNRNCSLEFPLPTSDGRDVAYWQSRYIVERSTLNHPPHEKYFEYFDKIGIKVFLQFESGNADPRELMDVTHEAFGHHECVVGFGYDVEWFCGTYGNDSGIIMNDHQAELYDLHAQSLNPDYQIFIKHYSPGFLPYDYRGSIIFCNDSQSLGSIDGQSPGPYDIHDRDLPPGFTMGFMPEYQKWADLYYPNEVCYQMGYIIDSQWYASLDEPVMQTLGDRFGDFTKQNFFFAWVCFATKMEQAYPRLYDPPYGNATGPQRNSLLNSMMGYLNTNPNGIANGHTGGRFGAYLGEARPLATGYYDATLADALYVARIRQIYDDLIGRFPDAVPANYPTRFTPQIESAAIEIRIMSLPDPDKLLYKDKPVIDSILAHIEAYIAARGVAPVYPRKDGVDPEARLAEVLEAWNKLVCKIAFELNGGNTSESLSVELPYGGLLDFQDPVRKGYDFSGWFIDSALTTPVALPLEIWGDLTLYAGWEAKTTVLIGGLEFSFTVNNSNVAVVTLTENDVKAILEAVGNGNEIIIDFGDADKLSIDLRLPVGSFKDVDKTIKIITDAGSFSVTTKQLWNNSGKDRLIEVREKGLSFKNV